MDGSVSSGGDGRWVRPSEQIDEACDRFEAAWRAGQDPRIEEVVAMAPENDRPALLRELIALEAELRRGRGEHPEPAGYRDRFPGQAVLVDAAFTETAPGRNRRRSSKARPDTGCNLLFGLLALQNNFIDRAALLAAFNEWVADRSRGLGLILLERGALSPSRHMLMEALVEEHLRIHGDDPERSLAALSSIGSVRDDLSRDAAPEVQASLAHVAAARTDEDDDASPTVLHSSVGHSTSAGTRFRIIRPHAKGGLGEVFVARDTELNRDVALKEIQQQFADDPSFRSRFEFEAEVTGGLEHPGIVPVYGLGHMPDGRPFYAMRFIKGKSLKDAIRRFHEAEKQPGRDLGRSTLELRDLLGRFIDVCDAVAYAHSRRVLHRDLKPGNIMLGKYGETLVVDWGLAKALDRPELESPIERSEPPLKPASGSALEPTLAGSPVGTPAYMSPEQVDGQAGRLGVRSDVYCLGATLYHLLTAHAPCEAEQPADVYRKILAGEIARPRALNPSVAPALEAICMRALALKPEERYTSPEALKADIELWLADEPLTAWREPLPIRARRWMRRNSSLVTAATVTVLVGLAALGIAYIRESETNRRLYVINTRLAESNARVAKARSEADANFRLANQAVDQMLTRVVNSQLYLVPRMEPVRRDLEEAALQYYQAFLKQRPADPVVRNGAARVLRMVANLHRTMGDSSDRPQECYREALDLLKDLASEFPDEPKYQDRMAETQIDVAEFLRLNGRLHDSVPHYQAARELAGDLHAKFPDDPRYRRTQARALYSIAEVDMETGRFDDAEMLLTQAAPLLSSLAQLTPLRVSDHWELAMVLCDLGELHVEKSRPGEAERAFNEATMLMKSLSDRSPDDPNTRNLLATAKSDLGKLLGTYPNRRDAAEQAHAEAISLTSKLVADQSETPEFRLQLAARLLSRGQTRLEAGRNGDALQDLQRSRELLEALLAKSPDMPRYHIPMGEVLSGLGRIALAKGDTAGGADLLKAALGHHDRALKANPENPTVRKALDRDRADLDRARNAH
jgi:serine/threonine-protein kinase